MEAKVTPHDKLASNYQDNGPQWGVIDEFTHFLPKLLAAGGGVGAYGGVR
jgi:hypothetical protein